MLETGCVIIASVYRDHGDYPTTPQRSNPHAFLDANATPGSIILRSPGTPSAWNDMLDGGDNRWFDHTGGHDEDHKLQESPMRSPSVQRRIADASGITVVHHRLEGMSMGSTHRTPPRSAASSRFTGASPAKSNHSSSKAYDDDDPWKEINVRTRGRSLSIDDTPDGSIASSLDRPMPGSPMQFHLLQNRSPRTPRQGASPWGHRGRLSDTPGKDFIPGMSPFRGAPVLGDTTPDVSESMYMMSNWNPLTPGSPNWPRRGGAANKAKTSNVLPQSGLFPDADLKPPQLGGSHAGVLGSPERLAQFLGSPDRSRIMDLGPLSFGINSVSPFRSPGHPSRPFDEESP